jgi:hypothetical protein
LKIEGQQKEAHFSCSHKGEKKQTHRNNEPADRRRKNKRETCSGAKEKQVRKIEPVSGKKKGVG